MVSERERWAPVEGYPNYEVSSWGNVYNSKRGHMLSQIENKGYLRVTLCNEDGCRQFYVHKLVGYTFYGYSLDKQVIHYDGNTKNNYIHNLRVRKRVRQAVTIRPLEGSEIGEYTRQWGKRVRIIETGEVFLTVRDCASYINGDYGSIYAVLRGERGSHRGLSFEYYDVLEGTG